MAKAKNPTPGAPAPKTKATKSAASTAPKETVAERQARQNADLEKRQSTSADQPGGATGVQAGEQQDAVANAADAAAAAMAGLDIARNEDGPGDGYVPRRQRAETIELETLVVLIERDAMQKIPKTIFAFELPILMGVHGQDKVHVVEASADVQDVEDFDVEETYDQLLRRYDRTGGDPVRKVYPRVQDLATELGIKLRKAKTRGAGYRPVANSSQQKDHSRDARAAAAE